MDKLPRNYRPHTNKYICHIHICDIYAIYVQYMWSMWLCALRREFAANWKCHGNGKQSPRRGAAPVAWNAWNGRQLKRVRCRTMWQSPRPASAEPQSSLRVEPELSEEVGRVSERCEGDSERVEPLTGVAFGIWFARDLYLRG